MAPTAKENTEGASNENTLTCIYTRAGLRVKRKHDFSNRTGSKHED